METNQFVKQFHFRKEGGGLVGVERECFLTDPLGIIQPISPLVLKVLKGEQFGYELSACQLEDRVGPCPIDDLGKRLAENDQLMSEAQEQMGFGRKYIEVAPADMPLDVYPDPTGRYQRITADMPREVLQAACRVAGTHIHIGMPDAETAMQVYHRTLPHLEELIKMGDGSEGERMRIYEVMAPDRTPKRYRGGWTEFHEYARQAEFESNPRSCWHLIRISVHGTIEFRMFGSVSDNTLVEKWAKRCHELCQF